MPLFSPPLPSLPGSLPRSLFLFLFRISLAAGSDDARWAATRLLSVSLSGQHRIIRQRRSSHFFPTNLTTSTPTGRRPAFDLDLDIVTVTDVDIDPSDLVLFYENSPCNTGSWISFLFAPRSFNPPFRRPRSSIALSTSLGAPRCPLPSLDAQRTTHDPTPEAVAHLDLRILQRLANKDSYVPIHESIPLCE